MDKTTKYWQRFKEDIKEISDKTSLSEDEVSEIMSETFDDLKSLITDPRMPTIKITNFGTFKPSPKMITWQIRSAIRAYRDGKIDRERAVNKVSHLWAIKQRLMKEKCGEITWKDWKDAKE